MVDTHDFALAQDPADHVAAYCTAFARGSGDLLDQLYEPGAVLVPKPGHPLTGAPQRIAAHNHLLGFGLPMTAETRHVYVAGDVALLIVDWSMGPSLRGTATDVARRGADGRWRYVIDNPFGTSPGR